MVVLRPQKPFRTALVASSSSNGVEAPESGPMSGAPALAKPPAHTPGR